MGLKWTALYLCVTYLAAGLTLAVVITAPITGALFADTVDTNQNDLNGGVMDLKLGEVGPTNGQGSTTDESGVDVAHDTWEDTNHDALGSDTVSNTLEFDNTASTVDVGRVNLTFTFAENDTDADDGNGANTSRTVEVTAFEYNGTDLIGSDLTDQNGNDRVDVEDLTLGSNAKNLSDRPGLPAGKSINLTVDLSGSADLIAGVGTTDGVDIILTIQVHTVGYTEADQSVDNTIQYA